MAQMPFVVGDTVYSQLCGIVALLHSLPDSTRFSSLRELRRRYPEYDTAQVAVAIKVDQSEKLVVTSDSYTFFRTSGYYWGLPMGKSLEYSTYEYFDSRELRAKLRLVVNFVIQKSNQLYPGQVIPFVR